MAYKYFSNIIKDDLFGKIGTVTLRYIDEEEPILHYKEHPEQYFDTKEQAKEYFNSLEPCLKRQLAAVLDNTRKYLMYSTEYLSYDKAPVLNSFDSREDVLMVFARLKKAQDEYDDVVQDTETDYREKDGKLYVDVWTVRDCGYGDEHIEFGYVSGEPIDITWDEVSKIAKTLPRQYKDVVLTDL